MTAEVQAANPATDATIHGITRETRIPLSTARRKLEVLNDLPGYHLHWFLESNVPAAIQGGYEFVNDKDIRLNQHTAATKTGISGNNDLGSNISLIGGIGADGKNESQFLMKIREEWWQDDQKVIENRNAATLAAIFKGEQIGNPNQANAGDTSQRYVKEALFQRPTRKR